MKKGICIFLIVLISCVFQNNCSVVQAAETEKILYSGKSGDLDWTIDGSGCLRITGVGDYYVDWEYDESGDEEYENVIPVGNWWGNYSDYITCAVVDVSRITSTAEMFAGMDNLKIVDLSMLDTREVTDMGLMFYGCSSMTKLDLSNFDTREVTDMVFMFYGCSSMTELDLSSFDTSNVTDMAVMFCGCSSLTKLDLSNFDTSNVTDMESMFSNCSRLSELDLSNFNTSRVKYMYRLFYECSSLKEIDLSNFNTSSVTSMDAMFAGCSGLTKLDVSGFDTSNVTDMGWWDQSLHGGGMFSGCSGLTELDVSNFDTSRVTSMGCMFSGCSGLTELDLSSFNTSSVTRMGGMFSECSGLTELDLSNFDTRNVTQSDGFFFNCNNLKKIISPVNTNAYILIELPKTEGKVWKDPTGKIVSYLEAGRENSMTYIRVSEDTGEENQTQPSQQPDVIDKNSTETTTQQPQSILPAVGTKYNISNGIYKVTKSSATNKEVTFVKSKSNQKTSVTIPAAIKIDGQNYKVTEVTSKALKNNKKLKSITIGKNVKKIGKEAFSGCNKLKKITIKSNILNSVGKNAIKGIDKKAIIKCPKKQLSKYKKLFKSKTGYTTTMKIKK